MGNFLEIITSLKAELWFKILASTIAAALTGLSAIMANKYIAVYNDAGRPLVGEAKKGNINARTLALSSFGLSIGFVIGFIPQSAAVGMVEVHIILLMGDILGNIFPKKRWGWIVAGISGIAWGYGFYWGLEGIQWLFDNITYPKFGLELGKIGDPYNAVFAIFPAMVIGYQFGWKHALWSGAAIVATFVVVTIWGTKVSLSPLAMALLAGMVIMFAIAIIKNLQDRKQRAKSTPATGEASGGLAAFFEGNAKIIQKNKWWFLASGILVALAASMFTLQQPQTINMWVQGDMTTVLITETVKTFSFIPLVAMTSLATGVYSPSGLTLSSLMGAVGALIGFLIVQSTGSLPMYLIGAGIGGLVGGLLQFGETYCLVYLSKWMDKNAVLRSMGEGIRTSMSQILTFSLLIGGVIASFVIGTTVSAHTGIPGLPAIGIILVLGMYFINKTFKKPLPEIAIGPTMAIVFGVIANVIYFAS